MADDEIRFHIIQLAMHQPAATRNEGRSFTFMEPLIFSCWDSDGQVISAQWCSQNPQILLRGQNVLSAAVLDGHWMPLWFAPDGFTLQVHTLSDAPQGMDQLEAQLATISRQLGFQRFVLHRIPKLVEDDTRCGAYAMCFLAHVVMGPPLPQSAFDLRTHHTNMRASFVQPCILSLTPLDQSLGKRIPRVIRATP